MYELLESEDPQIDPVPIRVWMARNDLGGQELAEKIGISKTAFYQLMKTKRTSTLTILNLCRVTGLTPNQIMVGWGNHQEEQSQ